MLSDWRRATPPAPMSDGDVHVWRITTGPDAAESWWSLLSPEEQKRATSLRQSTDRLRYVVSHGAMRTILGAYIEIEPTAVAYAQGKQGKPSLIAVTDLQFNLTHSGDLALLAVARSRLVGVDVVQQIPNTDHAGIASRVFTPAEQAALDSASDRIEAFYRTWARKEGALKARGFGLSSPAPDLQANDWETFDVDAGSGYSAAIVVARPVGAISLFDFAEV